MTAHELLVQGRNLLADPKDWRQSTGNYGSGDGSYCAREAISCPFGEATGAVHFEADAALAAAAGCKYVPDWNDDPRRTHAEVLAAFDKAIAATAPAPDLSFLADVRVEAEARP